MKKFKVGDKVRIREDLKAGERYGAEKFVEEKICKIKPTDHLRITNIQYLI